MKSVERQSYTGKLHELPEIYSKQSLVSELLLYSQITPFEDLVIDGLCDTYSQRFIGDGARRVASG